MPVMVWALAVALGCTRQGVENSEEARSERDCDTSDSQRVFKRNTTRPNSLEQQRIERLLKRGGGLFRGIGAAY
jgi:hypothetical protein